MSMRSTQIITLAWPQLVGSTAGWLIVLLASFVQMGLDPYPNGLMTTSSSASDVSTSAHTTCSNSSSIRQLWPMVGKSREAAVYDTKARCSQTVAWLSLMRMRVVLFLTSPLDLPTPCMMPHSPTLTLTLTLYQNTWEYHGNQQRRSLLARRSHTWASSGTWRLDWSQFWKERR